MLDQLLFYKSELGVRNSLLTLFLKKLGITEKKFSLEDLDNLNEESGIYDYVENGKIYLTIFDTYEDFEKLKKQHPITINDYFALSNRSKKQEKVDIDETIEEIKDLLNSLRD